jgi:hypothetical protein
MKNDTRLFKYAGSSREANGSYKARFANNPENRVSVLTTAGNTEIVLVELPMSMTKSEAILYLQSIQATGVNQDALAAKAKYIANIEAKLAAPKRGRGRPRKNSTVTVNVVENAVNAIVNKVKAQTATN